MITYFYRFVKCVTLCGIQWDFPEQQSTPLLCGGDIPDFCSPSAQEWNPYVDGGTEEQYMNLLADAMEPYLKASGIAFVRNDPDRNVAGAIADSNGLL